MRKVILTLIVSVSWLAVGPVLGSPEGNISVLADGMLLPLPETPISDYLGVRYHHVEVRIKDGLALTRVKQEFYNPYDFPIEGRYLFPVPPEAMLSRFQATVDGQRQQAIRQGPSTTNAALFAVVAQQHDPSLLEYADWDTLAFDLSLPPHSSRRMSLEYEEVLVPAGGLYHYRYVLSTERYSSQPLEEVSVSVDISSSSGLASVYSSSHPVITDRLGSGRAQVTWEAHDVFPDVDFELFFAPTEGGYGGGLLTGQHGGQGHFLFLFSPEAEMSGDDYLPKDIVFVVDRSGSMSGEKIEHARGALHFILDQLGEDDRFAIVSFSERISVLHDTLQPVDQDALGEAGRYVDAIIADGSTDLEAALQAGLGILHHSEDRGALRLILFLTDGLPTAGITDEQAITRLVAQSNAHLEARLHVFGVGYDVNTHLLDRLSSDNGGTVTYVQPGENLESALTQFYAEIAQPLLTDIRVEFQGLRVSDLQPEAMPDLFQGATLLLAGRCQQTGDWATIRVWGRAGDKQYEYVYRFDLQHAGDHPFVPRLWATRRIGALLDRVRVQGESQPLVDEIRELGLRYGLVTPYTTFVIEAQAEGAASAENLALYDSAELNRESGQTTIMARVQNQAYQGATQANLAQGANVFNSGQYNLAQMGSQNIDLSLLHEQKVQDVPISTEWIERNIKIDRTVAFGSDEYFALASDPDVRLFLQSGPNVIFGHQGQVISVEDAEHQGHTKSPVGAGGEPTELERPAEKQQVQPGSTTEAKGAGTRGSLVHQALALLLTLARMIP